MADNLHKLTVQEATNQIAQRKVIRVIPTIETAEYESGDVIFNSVAIPNAVMGKGGCSKLLAAYMVSNSTDNLLFEMIFTENSATFGTVNATANITDGNIKASNVLGFVSCESADDTTNYLDNSEIKRVYDNRSDAANDSPGFDPILLQAASGSTSVYFAAIGGTTVTFGADELEFIFHIERE